MSDLHEFKPGEPGFAKHLNENFLGLQEEIHAHAAEDAKRFEAIEADLAELKTALKGKADKRGPKPKSE